jgi:hypothetical protein
LLTHLNALVTGHRDTATQRLRVVGMDVPRLESVANNYNRCHSVPVLNDAAADGRSMFTVADQDENRRVDAITVLQNWQPSDTGAH